MKTTVLKQGDATYTRSHEHDNWDSFERGVKEGDTRVIDGVLRYAAYVGPMLGSLKRNVYWRRVDIPQTTPSAETPSKKARK